MRVKTTGLTCNHAEVRGGDTYADVKSIEINLDIFQKGGSDNEKVLCNFSDDLIGMRVYFQRLC
jgi:hypothetical protein